MDTIIATFAAIAAQAPEAVRPTLDKFDTIIDKLGEAAIASFGLCVMTDERFVETGDANRAASTAVETARQAQERVHLGLIGAIRDDKEIKPYLRPFRKESDVRSVIESCIGDVAFINREMGDFVDVLVDGKMIGMLDAYDISLEDDHLVTGDFARWPIADIMAGGIDTEEDDAYGFVLTDGVLVEIRRRRD